MSRELRLAAGLGLLLFGWPGSASADTPTAQAMVAEGIRTLNQAYDQWSRPGFEQAVEIFKTAAAQEPGQAYGYYWQGAAWFFLASYDLQAREQDKNPGRGAAAAAAGVRVLTQAIALDPGFSESYALRGVLRGMLIQLNPWAVFTQGPGVQSDRDRALALDPANPRVHYLTGISLWKAPEIFGGGSQQALAHFLKAEELFARESGRPRRPLDPVWGRSTCLSFIGDVYARQGDRAAAERYYRKALEQNPLDLRAREGLAALPAIGGDHKEASQ